MSILFRCADCGTETKVDESLAGKRIKCRECDMPGRVPFEKRKILLRGAAAGFILAGILMLIVASIGSTFLIWYFHTHPASSQAQAASQPEPPSKRAANEQAVLIAQQPEPQANPQAIAEAERRHIEEEQRRHQEAMAKAREEARLERIRQKERALAELTEADKVLTRRIADKVNNEQNITFGDLQFMDRHWILFDVPAVHQSIRRFADTMRFEEFCDNLGIQEKDRPAFARTWLLDLGSGPKCLTAVSVSRSVKQKGIANLPSAYKRFISEHQQVFAILK